MRRVFFWVGTLLCLLFKGNQKETEAHFGSIPVRCPFLIWPALSGHVHTLLLARTGQGLQVGCRRLMAPYQLIVVIHVGT